VRCWTSYPKAPQFGLISTWIRHKDRSRKQFWLVLWKLIKGPVCGLVGLLFRFQEKNVVPSWISYPSKHFSEDFPASPAHWHLIRQHCSGETCWFEAIIIIYQKWQRKVGGNPEFWVYQAAISLSINCKSEEASSLFCTRNTLVSYIYQKFDIIYLFWYFAYCTNRTFCIVPTEHVVSSWQLESVTVCKDWFFLKIWSKAGQL